MTNNTIRRTLARRCVPGLTVLVRLALGCLFISSSLSKIQQAYDFLHDVYNYEIVGPKLGLLVAMVLPWMELVVGVCLRGGIFISGALLVCVGMAAMFSSVIVWALYQGLDISCGCFGSGTDKVTYLTLMRALVILLVSAAAYFGAIFYLPQAYDRS
jgi:uncharacterized membrane protein YphA (DoxX/SURF4 family)